MKNKNVSYFVIIQKILIFGLETFNTIMYNIDIFYIQFNFQNNSTNIVNYL